MMIIIEITTCSGAYEPTDDECCLPESENTAAAAAAEQKPEVEQKMAELTTNDDSTVGISDFWIGVLKFNPMFESEITEKDETVLKV